MATSKIGRLEQMRMSGKICVLDECSNPIEEILGIVCACGACQDCCNEICIDDQCNCTDNLLAVKLDSEFKTEKEMQEYAKNEGLVILTKHTKSIVDEDQDIFGS